MGGWVYCCLAPCFLSALRQQSRSTNPIISNKDAKWKTVPCRQRARIIIIHQQKKPGM